MGNAVVRCLDTEICSEICQEMWVVQSPHLEYFMDGVEIVSNSSASHHQLRKLDRRLELIRSSTAGAGGVYMYSN